MKKKLLLLIVTLTIFSNSFGQNSLWSKVSEDRISLLQKMDRASMPNKYDLYFLDLTNFKNLLQEAPLESNANASNLILPFPNSNGELQNYRVYESPIMEEGLAIKFPEIKTYVGKSIDDPSTSIRLSVTVFGLHVMSLSGNSGTYYIDTYTKDLNYYIVYNRKNLSPSRSFTCLVQDEEQVASENKNVLSKASDGLFRTYRLAMACTIEYAAFHVTAAGVGAGTLAQKKAAVLSAMVVTMARVNGVYERDMSLRMNLVANNDLIIFIDSDSFSNTLATSLINESQTVIDATIGSANYDIGHTVSTGGGGLAQRPSVCVTGKARGITGSSSPVGDAYDIDYVAHEIGHQFGANHTFAGDTGSCAGNRSNSTAVEPGSGTTIMAYAGICSPQDVQLHSDDYFHAVSIAEMVTHVTGSGNCVTGVANGNSAPVIPTLSNYTIPKGTAFKLTAPTVTDANGDALTYCWEQNNGAFTANSTAIPSTTATNSTNFRSFSPVSVLTRYFPKFSDVLNGNLTPTWEMVPNVARTMNFALTVRDNRIPNGGQTARRDNVVTFASVGPFQITSPNVVDTSWPLGSTQTITWDVAGTTANGINTANVKISISTDGGTTFTTLIASTPNDGSETITVPNTLSTTGRIMIEAIGNIFYAVSKNIAIGYTIVNACNTYTDNVALPFVDQAPGNYTTRTMNVPITGTISDVNVTNSLTHTYLSDVQTDISSAQAPATFVKLFNRSCGSTSGTLNMLFNDGAGTINCAGGTTLQTVAPNGSLSSFNGQNPQGNWTFRVYDNYSGDTGTINSWALEVCTQTVTLLTENFGLEDFGIFPNPSNGNFNVKFKSVTNGEINILVHDMRGRLVYNKQYQNTGLINQNIQLSSVQSGVYLVTVQDGERKEVKKIVVE